MHIQLCNEFGTSLEKWEAGKIIIKNCTAVDLQTMEKEVSAIEVFVDKRVNKRSMTLQ